MLQLRVYGERTSMAVVADELERLPGARHLTRAGTGRDSGACVTADVRADAADEALAVVERMGVPADDVVFVRVDKIGVHLALLPTNEDRAKAVIDWAGAALTHHRVGRITVNAGND